MGDHYKSCTDGKNCSSINTYQEGARVPDYTRVAKVADCRSTGKVSSPEGGCFDVGSQGFLPDPAKWLLASMFCNWVRGWSWGRWERSAACQGARGL